MSETTTPADVIAFIVARADEVDLANILNAYKARQRTLRQITAASVKVGAYVTLGGLSPKYLNGLTGHVKSIDGQRCTVTLDDRSTSSLRYAGQRFRIPTDVKFYDLGGIPTSCAKVNDVLTARA